jgi:hypothetical protein
MSSSPDLITAGLSHFKDERVLGQLLDPTNRLDVGLL